MKRLFLTFLTLLAWTLPAKGIDSLTSGDAYAKFDPITKTWTCGTRLIEQRLLLSGGKFRLVSLQNRLTGTELVAGADSDEFRFVFSGKEESGRLGEYTLKDYQVSLLPVPNASPGIEPGVSLTVNLEHPHLLIALHYDVYASTPRTPLGMIRKWYQVTNRTTETQALTEISMNHLRLRNDLAPRLTLYHWQGGGADHGTNEMQAEPLEKQRSRTFSSLAGAAGYRTDDVYSGSASYHPYFVLEDSKSGEGLFLGFNYLGPWSMRIWNAGDYPGRNGFLVSSQLELHQEPLAPGATFESPNSFLGVYRGDLDSANEQLQDWQATFKWDYTRESYLWGTVVVNSHWNDSKHKQRTDLHTQVMWRIADLCRRAGAQIAHEDDFWFDQRGRGVWEGIDWGELVNYLRQSGIHFRLWMPPRHAPGTPPDVEHPEWALSPKEPDGITGWYGLGSCVAAQGAHDYMRQFILDRESRYGAYYYRLDGWVQAPCRAENHDHPVGQPHIQQYRHFLQMLKDVKEANPDMAIQGCNSGGEWCNWDKLELLENNQMSDGGGPDDFYYLSYFWPITKMMEAWGSDSDRLEENAVMERQQQDILFRRYLQKEGVIGRFMRVYHPRADRALTPHCYLEITSPDRTKAVIWGDSASRRDTVVYPKGLVADAGYQVTFRFNKESRPAKGLELMRKGVRFNTGDEREMILLNLDSAPGHGADNTPPSAPVSVSKQVETWGGRTGVAVHWLPGQDDNLIAGYRVRRDGRDVDFVAIGTFYFDAAVGSGIDRRYEIVSIDGDGNRSSGVGAVQ